MTATAQKSPALVTADEFLTTTTRLGPGKHQLIDGVIVAMAPASPTHGVIQINFGAIIRAHLREKKLPCQVMGEAGVQPRLHKKTNVRVHDLTVSCGPVPGPGDRLVATPIIVIEVLSPSNPENTQLNISACATISSIKEMLIIESTQQRIEYWQRLADGSWPDEPDVIDINGAVTLASINLTVPLADIYTDTHLSTF